MNYKLVLSVLFVTLCWRFMVTSAQSKTTNLTSTTPSTAGATNSTNVTTTSTLTVAPTQSQNTAVAVLTTTITETGCGSTKLCAAQPSTCDPSSRNQCYFISVKQQSGQLYNFVLSGQSDGYLAAGLSTGTDPVGYYQAYFCENISGVVNIFPGTINNYTVNLTPLNVSNVKGAVSSGKIQCTFGAILPNTTQAAAYSLSVATGSYNDRQPGKPTFMLQTNVVDLSNPNATITNLIRTTNTTITNLNSTTNATITNLIRTTNTTIKHRIRTTNATIKHRIRTTNLINNTTSKSDAYPAAHQQSLMITALLLPVIILVFTTQ